MQPELFQQMRELEDQHWWFQGRRRIVSTLLGTIALPDNAKLLDLGCGTGGNLEMLSGFGDVTGVELDASAAELARQRGWAPVLRGRLPDELPFGDGGFDCVTMLDVLEHIEQDAASLETVNRLLVQHGHVLLTVPAFEFLWGPHDEAHHHQRRYRAGALRSLLQAAGFSVIRLSYYNTWLFPPAALVRLLRKFLPSGDAGVELTLPPSWMNRMLGSLFASERHVLKHARFPFGISLLAVAQKNDSAAQR
jgi:SAM-dependent methyltransferase